MSETVVQLNVEDQSDLERLTNVLDEFARWCEDFAKRHPDADTPEFMLTTEHNGNCCRRKIIFDDRRHADQFLVFWKSNGFPTSGAA